MSRVEALSRLRLPALLHSVRCAVIELDMRGHILSFNPEAERLHGCDERDVVGAPYLALFVPREYREAVIGQVQRVVDGCSAVGVEYPIVGRDGVLREVLWNLTVINPTQGPAVLVAVGRDLTDDRRRELRLAVLEQRLREKNLHADLGIVAAEIVHDVGRPLTGLALKTARLAHKARVRDCDPLSTIAMELRDLERGIAALAELVRRFKTSSFAVGVTNGVVHLRTLLEDVARGWVHVAFDRDITLELDIAPASAVKGNAEQLRRACDNLVQNAIDAIGDDQGHITIRTKLNVDQTVRVEIADTGSGAAPSVDPFELFRTTKPRGSGIGLNVVRRIVEEHGGTVGHIANEPRGMVFFFELPQLRFDDTNGLKAN